MDERLLKKEIDTYLEQVKLSDQMKRNIQLACSEDQQKSKYSFRRYINYKKVSTAMLLLLICSSTIMAMDYTLGLGLFFKQEEIEKVINEVQYVKAYDENQNVKMEVKEVLNQGHGAIATVEFTNLGDKPWTKDVVCQTIRFVIGEHEFGYPLSDGVLSSDGRQLTYCISINNTPELISNSPIKVKADKLMKKQSIEKEIKIPLKDFKVTEIGSTVEKNTQKEVQDQGGRTMELREFLNRRTEGGKTIVIDEEYPSVLLKGIAIVNIKGDERYEENERYQENGNIQGIVIHATGNKPYIQLGDSREVRSQKIMMEYLEPYTEGEITELVDTRTGQVYKAEKFDYYGVYDILCGEVLSFFPNVTPDQIPYLEATKIVYDKQDVLVDSTWEVEFKIDLGNVKKWETNIQMDKTDYKVMVDEVYLSSTGIQVKERTIYKKTNRFAGYFNSYWLDITLIDNQGKKIKLENVSLALREDKDTKSEYYIITYKNCDQKQEFIDVNHIKKVIINGNEINCQR